MKGHPRQRNQEGYNANIMDNPLEVYPPHTSPYGSFQQQPRMTTEIPQVSPSMGSPYQQNAYQRQAPGNPPFLAHAMPFQTGLPIDQAQTQMVYLSYPNSYPQLIPQIMPQQHQFPAAIPQSRPQFPRYANQSQPFVQPRFSQSNNPAQYFTPFPHTNGQVPLQVPPTTQQPPPQKRERKPLAIVDPNTNEEVSISPDSVSRSRSESTSEGPKQPDNSEQIKVEFAKQVAATIGESPPVDVPSSVESSVVDQQVESELMVPPAFIDTSMPPPLKSAEPTQERPSLLNGVTEELVVPEKKLEEEPAPSIEIEVPNQVPVQDVDLPSPLVENEEQEETIEVSEISSSQVFNSKTLSNPVMPVDPIVDLPVPTVVVEPPPVLEISVAAQEESIPIPQNTIHEPDVEEGKESDFPADSPPESPLPDIEQHENPSVKLIYPYKEGQWSPLNPSGTKKYDTEFLKMIQDSPLAKITPNIPADISSTGPSFKQPASWNQGRKQMNQGYYDTAGADAMSPAYLRSSMQGNRTPLPQRLSQGKGMHRPTTVINIPVAQPKAAFPKVENAWVPDTFAKKKVTDKEEQKTIDLKKAIRGRLNKLTPENYDKISKNILEMEVDTEERLSAIIQIFFDKAVDEPIYAPKYAELCKLMFEKEVPSASGTGKVSFRKLLLDRCQATFEKEKKDEEEIVSKQKALEEADTEEKKKELQMELNERISKTKRIMLGNIRFIGELFKLRMLTIKIMNFCISKLLKSRDEEQLECLCKLISTIGKTYEEEYDAKYQRAVAESKSSGKQLQIQLTKLDVYLDEMKKLSQSEDLSSRIKFMLMDVLDLKQNRWVPRREGEKPKTIDEIRGELEKERLEKELSLQEDIIKQPQMGYPSQRRDGGRGDERKKSRSAVDDGGWQISQGKKGSLIGQDQSSYRPPPRMTSQPREMKLGPTKAWSKGAGLTPTAVQTGGGRYSALLDDEGSSVSSPSVTNIRLGPPRSMGHRGAATKSMGPVPTERQKAVQATRSFTRSRSQQASRESSLSRQGAATPTTEQVPFQAKSELKGKPDLTEDEIQRKTDNIINEFLYNGDLQEAVECVKEQMHDKSIVQFIENGLNNVIERKPVARADFGKLLRELLTKQLISREGFIKGFRTILEGAIDIIVDIPQLFENLAQILVPALEQDAQCLHAVKDMEHLVSEEMTTRGRLAAAVLAELVKSKDKETATRLWHASGLTWESFGAKTSDNVEQLISSKNLDFTRNSPGSHLASHPERREPSSKKFSSESRNQLYRIFKESSRDDAIAQAQERIPSDEKSLSGFVRDVVTVITDICLQGDSQHKEINKTQFIEWTEFISKLISNSQELELQALYAVQSIDNKLAHPKGFINDMAFILYENDVISEQAFILWKDSPPTSEHEGHAICMKSLNRFFQALATDDEESSKA